MILIAYVFAPGFIGGKGEGCVSFTTKIAIEFLKFKGMSQNLQRISN